jgi:hypothetical protein
MKHPLHLYLSGLICFAFFSLLFYSCSNEIDCNCIITPEEEQLVSFYHAGDIVGFKNDSSGVTDIMHVISKGSNRSGCSSPCANGAADVVTSFEFSHLLGCRVSVWHRSIPNVTFSNATYFFELKETLQSMTVNNITYDDVYVSSIDSTKIEPGNQNRAPWKIAYSKSKGFIRFYMVNGQTWNKSQ